MNHSANQNPSCASAPSPGGPSEVKWFQQHLVPQTLSLAVARTGAPFRRGTEVARCLAVTIMVNYMVNYEVYEL